MNDDLEDSPLTTADGIDAARYIRDLAGVARSPYTDGFTACSCKHQLYVLKCFIEDQYKTLPEFPQQEKEWEQKRLMEILKK